MSFSDRKPQDRRKQNRREWRPPRQYLPRRQNGRLDQRLRQFRGLLPPPQQHDPKLARLKPLVPRERQLASRHHRCLRSLLQRQGRLPSWTGKDICENRSHAAKVKVNTTGTTTALRSHGSSKTCNSQMGLYQLHRKRCLRLHIWLAFKIRLEDEEPTLGTRSTPSFFNVAHASGGRCIHMLHEQRRNHTRAKLMS